MEFKEWQARGPEAKAKKEAAKRKIQEEFRLRTGLIVDVPRTGGSGNSNDGNTARRFFGNHEEAAEICQLDKEVK